MFKVDEYVKTKSSGVCKIVDMLKIDQNSEEATDYFILSPVYQNNMTIKIPVNNANALMRPLLTKDEVLSLIAAMPEKEPLQLNDNKERSNTFKAALKSRNNEDLITIVKTLYQEKQAKTALNKKLTKADEDIMNIAEKQLNEEFALALHITPDEVVPFIHDYLSGLEKQA